MCEWILNDPSVDGILRADGLGLPLGIGERHIFLCPSYFPIPLTFALLWVCKNEKNREAFLSLNKYQR